MMVGEIVGIWVRGCSDDSCGILLHSQSLWRNEACCVVGEVVVERWNRLSDDGLAFGVVEVVWRDFEVQLGNSESVGRGDTLRGKLTGAGPFRIRPATSGVSKG